MADSFHACRQPAAPTPAFALWALVVPLLSSHALAQPSEPPPQRVEEVVVSVPEPRYVAPTTRDRIGRIWAPVLINGKGPYRLVLDTGASRSAVIQRVVDDAGLPLRARPVRLRGVTGAASVPAVLADTLEFGELVIEKATLPVVADVFGGADGVLGAGSKTAVLATGTCASPGVPCGAWKSSARRMWRCCKQRWRCAQCDGCSVRG